MCFQLIISTGGLRALRLVKGGPERKTQSCAHANDLVPDFKSLLPHIHSRK